jgi:ribosomal protein L37E
MITKTISNTNTYYHYECQECGNEFSKSYQVTPNKCSVCDTYGDFKETIVQRAETEILQLCPICKQYFKASPYLNQVFADTHARWLANMVTHYRHQHNSSWNKMWGRNGRSYCSGFMDYDDEEDYEKMKQQYNERAKRQILRKCKDFMLQNGFKVDHVMQLQHNDTKTIELYRKLLS